MQTMSAVLPPQILLSGSTLYASQGSVYALETKSGKVRQQYPISGVASPAIAYNVLFLNVSRDPDYLVQAVRESDGSSLWSYQVEGRPLHAPVIADGVVYVSLAEGSIYALQASDGMLLWRATIDLGPDIPSYLGPLVSTPPTVLNETVYLAPAVNAPLKPFLYAFRAKDGVLLWQAAIPEVSSFPFAVADGILYLSTSRGCLALRTNDGSVIWQQEIGENIQVYSPPVVLNGRVYFSSSELRTELSSSVSDGIKHWQQAFLCALRSSDGTLLWRQDITSASRPTELAVVGNVLYVSADDGTLSAYRSDDGTSLWRYQTSGVSLSTPTGTSEAVYVAVNNGCVYAFRATDGMPLWQTFVSTVVTSATGISLSISSEDA